MECDICKQKKHTFKCDGCNNEICKTCGALTSSEIKVLELNSRVMKFFCKKCQKGDSFSLYQMIIKDKDEIAKNKERIINSKDQVITDKDEIIILLKKEIEDLKKSSPPNASKGSYSAMVKTLKPEVLIVKPKKKQESATTKTILEENINPSTLGVGVSRVKYIRDGGVAVSCKHPINVEDLSVNIQEQLGNDYEVKIPKSKNPKIKIINVDKKIVGHNEEFVEKIILQNGITTPETQCKLNVITQYENKHGRINIILEIDPLSYQTIIKKDNLAIGWRCYKFFDHINVVQCYKCYKFGHMAKYCKSSKFVCPKCSNDHQLNECEETESKCANCKYAAQELKISNIDFNHVAYDKNCATYKRIYEELKQKISYPDIYAKKQ